MSLGDVSVNKFQTISSVLISIGNLTKPIFIDKMLKLAHKLKILTPLERNLNIHSRLNTLQLDYVLDY